MAIVGERKRNTLGKGYEKNMLHDYAKAFTETARNILTESGVDFYQNTRGVLFNEQSDAALKRFFIEGSYDPTGMTPDEIEDYELTMEAQYENDKEAILEHTAASQINPIIGLSFPFHKNILMNMVFDKGAIPKVVAQSPKFTITMETRILVDTEGNEIDMYLEQDKMTQAIDNTAKLTTIDYTSLPLLETDDQDIVQQIGGFANDHLSIETRVCAVLVKDVFYKVGDILPDPETGYVEVGGEVATAETTADTWFRRDMPFQPGYDPDFDRTFMRNFKMTVPTGAGENDVKVINDTIVGTMRRVNGVDKITLNALQGQIDGLRLETRIDTSSARATTCSVRWKEDTTLVEIPNAIPLNTTISPEEVKDISALYNVNQITKIMSLYKTALGNYKDDKIKQKLDESFKTMNPMSKKYGTFDYAPRAGYANDHVNWRRDTFFDYFDSHVTDLLQVLNDPNMVITVFGAPDIVRKIVPPEYSYQTPDSIGAVELDYTKTVFTSDKRLYQFIGSDKLRNTTELIVILCPRGSERITYRIYDYQMYLSNEIRNADNPALPALHSFERWKFVEYQPVQGRINILHKEGITEDYSYFPVSVKEMP